MNKSIQIKKAKRLERKLQKRKAELYLLQTSSSSTRRQSRKADTDEKDNKMNKCKSTVVHNDNILPSQSATCSTSNSTDEVLRVVSAQLKSERAKRCPGPNLQFTINRLNGGRLMPENIRDLLVYSLIGYSSCKPIWCNYRTWKATSQAILIRVNSNDALMEVDKV
jgi:hypothetical protein